MPDSHGQDDTKVPPGTGSEGKPAGGGLAAWLDLLRVVAIPLVTLILGFVFNASLNSRQTRENNIRLYTEMMGRREESDSALRKDMFNSILGSFMSKDPKLTRDEQLDQEVLNLELLAYNFHESLDLGPLFKHVRRRIPDGPEPKYADMRDRLAKVTREVIERQLTVLSDSGMVEKGDVGLDEVGGRRTILFGAHAVPGPEQGISQVCLSMDSTDGTRHYRQFGLEIVRHDPVSSEVQVELYASRLLDEAACQRGGGSTRAREVRATFWVGTFDFPMIDNVHLTRGERCAVALAQVTPHAAKIALAYFPGSRASLKEKPYYDDLVHDLIGTRPTARHDDR